MQIPFSLTKVRRIRRHHLLESRRERKDLVLHLDRLDRILCQILGFRGNDGDDLALEVEFLRQRISRSGAFLYVRTYATPGIFSASEVSMFLILARGCGLVRNFTWSMLGNTTLVAYSALPVNRGMATSGIGGIGFPTTFRFSGG